MLLIHPKQSRNVQNNRTSLFGFAALISCLLAHFNKIKTSLWGSKCPKESKECPIQRPTELKNCIKWGPGVFEHLTITNMLETAVNSHQHLLLKNLDINKKMIMMMIMQDSVNAGSSRQKWGLGRVCARLQIGLSSWIPVLSHCVS